MPGASRRQRSRRAFGRARNVEERCALPHGTSIVILGLSKSPEHNRKLGRIAGWDGARRRYEVIMVESGDRLFLRAQNITQLCKVEVTGLSSRPELNGQTGEIFGYDASKRRYIAAIDGSGDAISLQPANCILSSGTCVVIDGLQATECNGQKARIVGVDRTACRY